MATTRPTYRVQSHNFSGGAEDFTSLVKALTAAKKLCQATIYRMTENSETSLAQITKVEVWTGNSADSFGGKQGWALAHMAQLTAEGSDTLLDSERRFFPRRG